MITREEPKKELAQRYRSYSAEGLSIHMERGWPCREQLDLSMPMLDLVGSETELVREVDYRGYAGTAGIDSMKALFAEWLNVGTEEIYIGGTMSTTLMYDLVNKAFCFGIQGEKAWRYSEVKMLCPSPGYEKHFNICETFGIKMIPIQMNGCGPDMDLIETIVKEDEDVKGIWCVPLYSNPTGIVYSDEVVERIAKMPVKAKDFCVIWDNAYFAHHLTEEKLTVKNILRECEKAGYPDRVFEFASTSKITFPGGGVAACASSKTNIDWYTKKSLLQMKSGDKINQLRHALFLKNTSAVITAKVQKSGCDLFHALFVSVDHLLDHVAADRSCLL